MYWLLSIEAKRNGKEIVTTFLWKCIPQEIKKLEYLLLGPFAIS
jgi:hypothetical protein